MALVKTYAGYCFAVNIYYSCKLKLQITIDRFLPFLTMSAQSRFSALPQLRHSPNFPYRIFQCMYSGVETVRGTGTKFSGWIGPPGGRVLLHFSRVRDARGTWHVLPRKGLQKFVRALIGQTRNTDDSKLAGHTCTIPICVLFWLPVLWGAGCTHQGRKTFLTWDPPVQGNFELETPNSVLVGRSWHGVLGAVRYNGLECCVQSDLHLLFFCLPCRPNEGHCRSQTCRSHVYCPNLYAFLVAVLVGCRFHAPGSKKFIRKGSSNTRKF